MTHAIHASTHRASTHQAATHPHPDASRIAGYSAAIALNAALLLVLLVLLTPMKIPVFAPRTEVIPVPRLIDLTPVKPQPPRPPIEKTEQKPTAAMAPARIERPQVPAPTVVDQGSEQAVDIPPMPIAVATPTIQASSSPIPGVRLEYLQAPPPDYPRAALRMRSQGTVLLQVLVDVDGKPLQVQVQDSSGDRRLDAAAREQVLRHWRFRPALQDGRAVQAIGLVPVAFNLGR